MPALLQETTSWNYTIARRTDKMLDVIADYNSSKNFRAHFGEALRTQRVDTRTQQDLKTLQSLQWLEMQAFNALQELLSTVVELSIRETLVTAICPPKLPVSELTLKKVS